MRAGLGKADAPAPDDAAAQVQPAADGAPDHARQQAFAERVAPLRTGSGEILVEDISIIDAAGADTDSVGIDEQVRIRVFFRVMREPPPQAVLNVGVTDDAGRQICISTRCSRAISHRTPR